MFIVMVTDMFSVGSFAMISSLKYYCLRDVIVYNPPRGFVYFFRKHCKQMVEYLLVVGAAAVLAPAHGVGDGLVRDFPAEALGQDRRVLLLPPDDVVRVEIEIDQELVDFFDEFVVIHGLGLVLMKYFYKTNVGVFAIIPDHEIRGSWRLYIGDLWLGSYESAIHAADDVYLCVTGFYEWDKRGVVDHPEGLDEWTATR